MECHRHITIAKYTVEDIDKALNEGRDPDDPKLRIAALLELACELLDTARALLEEALDTNDCE